MPSWLIPFMLVDTLICIGVIWYVMNRRKA
jgi:hypothetical protein